MRRHRSRTIPTLACIVAVATATSACGAGRTRPDPPAPDEPREEPPSHTRTASDSYVGRDRYSQSYARLEELIEGRAPGVRVIHHRDGSFRLLIRGVSSPSGRNDPLVVIDGTPTSGLRSGSALTSLNPADVLRIEVLKDAASTAFYGMRGANCVIVITTRQQ